MDSIKRQWERYVNAAKAPDGFSLVEILVAMAVFLVVSAGVTSMMLVGIRSTADARLTTMGKEAAQQEMEAIRARTFYVPYSSDPDVGSTGDVDVLDRYFPNTNIAASIDSWGWEGWYTESAGDAYYTVVSPEDTNSVVLTVEARFIDYYGNVITPVVSYDSNVNGADTPPSDLLAISVTASWLSRGSEERYTVESVFSRVDQLSQGGSDDGGGEAGCSYSSTSSIDVFGGRLTILTGPSEPYSEFLSGELGSADGTASYDCTSSLTANAVGGDLEITGVDVYTGASASVVGPSQDSDSSGPMTVGPTSSWPILFLNNSSASAAVESSDDEGILSSASDSSLEASSVELQQVDGGLSGYMSLYSRWDFVNPVLATATSVDKVADAVIEQENGVSIATGQVAYDEINILPLQAYTAGTPAAPQGLVIVRDFEASAISEASEANGSASNSVNYSASIGMFNLSKAPSCSGDSCYDFYSISPESPIQSVINLSDADYALQNALINDWHSYTGSEISSAVYAAGDGSMSMISIDALLKIDVAVAEEIRQKTTGTKRVSIMSQQGALQLWLGSFDISVQQNGA
jgi:prepilin-type N-terminal cleavage/methylation domain-containing protein